MLRLEGDRRRLVAQLVDVAFQAGRVLVHGPWGIGKTTILLEVARNARDAGVRVGYCPTTRSLSNVVDTLERAYTTLTPRAVPARQRRSVLRSATEEDRGLLILDGLNARGTALIGFLRSLRGKRLAVIAAADVEQPRDLLPARASGVAYRELPIPLLPPRELGKLMDRLAQRYPLPFELPSADRGVLLNLAAGRPGVLERAWARLREARYWRGALPLVETVRADVRLEWLVETGQAVFSGRPN